MKQTIKVRFGIKNSAIESLRWEFIFLITCFLAISNKRADFSQNKL